MTERTDHPSDAPGHLHAGSPGKQRYESSGPSSPSLPRHVGTGERQAPRREYTGAHPPSASEYVVPGEVLHGDEPVVVNADKPVVTVRVANTSDRPIQIGSHFHFAEVNSALGFDRETAWGHRLNIASGGSVRFEPGIVEEVRLVPIGGQRIVYGLRGLCGGSLDG